MFHRRVRIRRRAGGIGALLALVTLAGCSIGTDLEDFPRSARVRADITAPDAVKLIVSTDFIEQINLQTLERYAVLLEADTLDLTAAYDQTRDISAFGSVYVELLYQPASTATVRLRVDLDNGESFDRSATLSTNAQLIYYWIWSGPLP